MAGGSTLAYSATSYTLTDLTSVSAGGFKPIKIKSNGTILGNTVTPVIVNNAYVSVPQVYDIATGRVTLIDSLATGDTFASSNDISTVGQAVGQYLPAASTTGVSRNIVVRNTDGTMTDLGLFVSTIGTQNIGVGINDAGQVLGVSYSTTLCSYRSFVGSASGGGFTSLGSLGGGTYDWTQAKAINASGQVVGRSSTNGACLLSDSWHAFVGTTAGLVDLQNPAMPTINPGNGGSTAYDINDFGFVAGEYPYAFGAATRVYPAGAPKMHGVIWDTVAGTYKDLGSANTTSTLYSINASGQAVGVESTGTTSYAVIGDIASGGLTNLNGLVTNLPTGWTLGNAFGISNAGEILVSATDTAAVVHYALLTPGTTGPVITVPSDPSALSATAASTTAITLAWTDNASNETTQVVERCLGAGCTNFAAIATLGANVTTYTNTGLASSTSYSYRVMAQGAAGNSGYSNTAAATTNAVVVIPTAPTTAPTAPSNLVSTAITNAKVSLAWTDNSTDETKFLIERCRGIACTTFTQIASTKANTAAYTDSNVVRNANYKYRVRAMNAVGKSAYTTVLAVKTLP